MRASDIEEAFGIAVMTVQTAQFLVTALAAYVAAGAMFAVLFVWRWVGRLDPLAEHGTIGFRLLVLPGVTAFWPLFVLRLTRGVASPPDEWTAHRAAARRQASGAEVRR